MHEINIRTVWKHSKNVEAIMQDRLAEALLNCTNYKELKEVYKNNTLVLKEKLDVSLFPESLSQRCDLVKAIKSNKEHEIKVVSVKKGVIYKNNCDVVIDRLLSIKLYLVLNFKSIKRIIRRCLE